jgi:hypothetical protein
LKIQLTGAKEAIMSMPVNDNLNLRLLLNALLRRAADGF